MTPFRAAVALAAYFALIWVVLAEDHRFAGAAVVFVIGAMGAASTRLRARTNASSPVPVSPLPAAIETDYAAEPEHPEHQRARFLGALGHELRNPLNSVTGFSDMLLGGVDGPLNAEQERSVRTIRASAERLLRLVSTIVDQAKLEAGTMRLQQQWVGPEELVSEMIEFTRSRAESTSVVGGVSDGLPRVFVDRHRTVQSLVSLAVLVIRSSDTDISIRVAPPRRDQSGRRACRTRAQTRLPSSKSSRSPCPARTHSGSKLRWPAASSRRRAAGYGPKRGPPEAFASA
jgi:signal transduction histidine kinase